MNVRCWMRWLTSRTITVVGICALAACSDPVKPGGLSGVYDLTLVNGEALPFVYERFGIVRTPRLVVDGTLEFNSATRATDIRNLETRPANEPPDPTVYSTTPTYRVAGDFLIVDRPGVPGDPLAYADTGYIDGPIIYLPVKTVDGNSVVRVTFTYVKR